MIDSCVHILPSGLYNWYSEGGKGTWLEIGCVVSNNVNIIDGYIIDASSVVDKNITEHGTYIGIPARKIAPCSI